MSTSAWTTTGSIAMRMPRGAGLRKAAIVRAAALAALVLSLTDGALTVVLGGYGVTEANPIMAVLLDTGTFWFLLMKCSITGICLLFFVRHADHLFFGMLRGGRVVHLVLGGYALIVAYELTALSLVVNSA